MRKLYFILFTVSFFVINAQNLNAYNTLYKKTYLETAQKDFPKALFIADSLYNTSETPYFKAKSLMLSASLYRQSGDVKKAVSYAERSAVLIESTDNSDWKARIYMFLSTQHRIIKLYGKSKNYSEKALEISKTIKDTLSRNNIRGFMYQELSYYSIDLKRYKKAIRYIRQSQSYLDHIKQDKDYLTATNEQLLGVSFYHLKDTDKALNHYENALNLIKNLPQNQLIGYVYIGLAQVYLEIKDLSNAKKYLDLAQKISAKSEHIQLKNEVYETTKEYYLKTKDIEKAEEAEKNKVIVEEKIATETNQFINESYTNLEKKAVKAEKNSLGKNYIISGVLLLLLFLGVLLIKYKMQQKKNFERFKQIIRESKQNSNRKTEDSNELKQNSGPAVKIREDEATTDTVLMVPETERKLLAKLKKFEKSTLFNKKSISLPHLAAHFETNTKYLSYIINTHRKKDFNNYINELRINYIIEKLKNDPQYRKYKVATLAEETGFSSPNKFTMIFKKVTALSPSVFISYLNKEAEQEEDMLSS